MDYKNIYEYEHPFVTVDGVILRFRKKLEILLIKRAEQPFKDRYSLVGGFVDIDKTPDMTLDIKIHEKTGVKGYYAEQLKTYGEVNRDLRGRIITIAYIGLMNEVLDVGEWFEISENELVHTKTGERVLREELAFDHNLIISDALERIRNKLWYSDIMKHLLGERFIARDVQNLVDEIEGKKVNNLRRRISDRIIELGEMTSPTKEGGRPAMWFKWNDDWHV